MKRPAVPSWPTTLFRLAHPAEAAHARPLLGLRTDHTLTVYVLVDANTGPVDAPRTAVAVEVRDGTWLIRAAYGVEDTRTASRVGNELLAAAVRGGATTVATPIESSAACRSILSDGRGRPTGGWIVAEL